MAKKTRKTKKAGSYEKSVSRKTGATVNKLEQEQRAAENIEALSKAKLVYAARGDVNSCGDWLAVALKDSFRTEDGSLDLTAFKACLKDNDIEAPKVDMERHGAIGRFRMCAGLMLRRHALKVGHVVIGGKKLAAPGAKKRGGKAKAAEAS